MTRGNLLKRLEELEFRLAPAGEPIVIQTVLVSSDGRKSDGPKFVVQGARSPHVGGRYTPPTEGPDLASDIGR
jgi:hypothetical protein